MRRVELRAPTFRGISRCQPGIYSAKKLNPPSGCDCTHILVRADGDRFPEQRGTAYNLLNAITDYTDHERASKANGHTAEWKRAESAMFGSGALLKSKALDVIETLSDGSERVTVGYSTLSSVQSSTSTLDAILADA